MESGDRIAVLTICRGESRRIGTFGINIAVPDETVAGRNSLYARSTIVHSEIECRGAVTADSIRTGICGSVR